MKRFARWLYIKMYKKELGLVAKYVRDGVASSKANPGIENLDWKASEGALDTLTTLDLFV